MESETIKIFGQIAGIGGIAFGVFLILFREVIRKNIFPTLTKEQSYKLIRLLLIFTFLVSLTGIGAWAISQGKPDIKKRENTISWNSLQSEYLEAFDIPYEGIEDVWRVSEDNIWSSAISNGKYCLTNNQGKNDIRYIYVGLKQKDVSDLPVSVEVKIANFNDSTPFSSGGLLYRFDRRNKFYYAFTISKNGNVSFYKRNVTGFNVIYSGQSDKIRTDGLNKLAIIGLNSFFYLYINDSLVKVIEDEELKFGDTGVIGVSIGKYCFDNFNIYKKTDRLPK